MRTQLCFAAAALTVFIAAGAGPAAAPSANFKTQAARSPAVPRTPAPQDAAASQGDRWRFKYYQGRWWYWLPSQKWVVYENDHWAPYDADDEEMVDDEQSFSDFYPDVPASSGDAKKDAAYYLGRGKAYSIHADDHAKTLEKYAATVDSVPAQIVKEHASAIHRNVQAAKRSFALVEKADREQPGLASAVEQLQQRLDQTVESVKQLQARVANDEAVEAGAVAAQSAEISQLLRDSYTTARQADRQFYDSQSEGYYFSGEGHFVD
jgi:hypothetical protein